MGANRNGKTLPSIVQQARTDLKLLYEAAAAGDSDAKKALHDIAEESIQVVGRYFDSLEGVYRDRCKKR